MEGEKVMDETELDTRWMTAIEDGNMVHYITLCISMYV